MTREWTRGLYDDDRGVLLIMLNPSTADATKDDPTIRRAIGFAKAWKCCSLTVVNLFAYRATDPKDLLARIESGEDAVGKENDQHIIAALERAESRGDYIVAAWGANGSHKLIKPRRDAVLRMLPVADTCCLETCASGDPKHPLYCKGWLVPVQYEFPRSAWEASNA
nr:DUF1643 domain-containing protein [Armatimonas rosea]